MLQCKGPVALSMFSLFGSSGTGTESPSASPQGERLRVVSFVQAVCYENCEMIMPRGWLEGRTGMMMMMKKGINIMC